MFARSYLQNIIVNAPIGIITTDIDLNVTFISESAKNVIGIHHAEPPPTTLTGEINEEEKAGKPFDEIQGSPEVKLDHITNFTSDPQAMMKNLEPVLNQEKDKVIFEVEIIFGDKSRTVQFTASLLRDDSFIPIGLLLICEDVTEQRETDRKYRNLMENSIDAVFIYKGEIVFEVNPAFSHLTGKELSPKRHLRWEDFIHPDSVERALDYARRREQGDTGVPDKFDCYGVGADGSKRFWRVSVSPIYPKMKIYAVLIHDQTDQKALEQQLIQTRKMETVSLLAGGIAHDFNNLLTGVLGYSSLIKSLLKPKDQIYGFINSIESSALHAKELNEQLVAFAGLGKYDIKTIDLNRAFEKTLRLLRLTINKRIHIKTLFGDRLKSIDANASQIQQLITNICINSIEAMPDGGTITVTTENLMLDREKPMGDWAISPGEYVHLMIADTGSGIPKKMINRIFEPFFSTKGVGFGLGLAAAYGIVKGHKGHISADSTQGKGTTINVYFPAVKKEKTRRKKAVKAAPKGKGKVLIVDDEDVVREILCDILKELGYNAIAAEDGERAVSIYEKKWQSIDVVFLDMIMPGMNGEETFQELKKINPDVKVIVCTGYTEEGPIQEMMNKGAVALIKKPFRMDDISSVTGEALTVPNGSVNPKRRE